MDRLNDLLPTSYGRPGGISWIVILSYLFDYGIIIALAIIYGLLDKFLQPNQQRFSLTNISLQYKVADPETVPIRVAMLYSCAIPIVTIAVYTLLIDGMFSNSKHGMARMKRYTMGQRFWELNCGVLGLFLAQGAAFVITGSLKNLIGKPRPDFIDRCNPLAGARDAIPWGLSNITICQTDHTGPVMQDGYRSFPSGHSSSSFAGLFFLSLYLAGKLHVLDQRGEVWRTVIVLIPTLGAAIIAGSRIIDARHHPFDVIFGSALGLLCGWGAYRQYFPPVSHSWEKGRAYPMRMWGMPLKRPDGVTGTDGQFYTYQRGNNEHTEDPEESNMIGMDSMPSNRPYSTAPGPSPVNYQQHIKRSSPAYASPLASSPDESSYEHVRMQGGQLTASTMPSQHLGSGPDSVAGSNAFRNQVHRNNAARTGLPNEEADIGYRA